MHLAFRRSLLMGGALLLAPLCESSFLAAQSGRAPQEGIMGTRPEATRFGGHIGVVVPAVRRGNDVTSNLFDRFVFGLPVGLTLKPSGPVAIDFEFIPTFNTGDDFVLTVHPGVVFGFASRYAVGLRAAYDAGSTNESFGVTPLLSRGFRLSESTGWFVELDLPIRRNEPNVGSAFTSVAIAAHVGITF